MKSFIRVAILGAALAVFGSSFSAAQSNIGIVNSETIIAAMPEFKQVQDAVQSLQQKYQDTVKLYKTELDKQVQQYQQQQGVMNDEMKAKEEKRLTDLQQQILAYQDYHLGSQGTVLQEQAKLIKPIRDRVIAAIEAVAKQKKLDAVLEKGGFLYVDTKLDITFAVLEYLQKGH